ncbi:periplasmic nitrate reductase, NapE protein [Photobacterium kishitanii]|uniref:periplasmic nitrate reductase, NapE protein n=1 Tax=Photobacterium kishitanii TaxID=318456 RepID=UPI003F74FF20
MTIISPTHLSFDEWCTAIVMITERSSMANTEITEQERGRYEWWAFLFITIFLFPLLSAALVGGYGFTVWALQVFVFGPPGHG